MLKVKSYEELHEMHTLCAIWKCQKLRRIHRTMRYVPAGFQDIPVLVVSTNTIMGALVPVKTATIKLCSAANGFPCGHILIVPESELRYE